MAFRAQRDALDGSRGARIPRSNGAAALTLDTTLLPDGLHTLSVQAVDAASNAGGKSRTILVDNTPPAAPLDLSVAGGLACGELVRRVMA